MYNSDLEGRIRYVEDWNGRGEHYLFELKHKKEEPSEWGLDTAFKIIDGNLVSFQALTTIREWKHLDIPFRFGK